MTLLSENMNYQGNFMMLSAQVRQDESRSRETSSNLARPQHPSFDWSLHRPSTLGEMQRHWCPRSQHYAGVDALFTAFDRGWDIIGTIYRDEYCLSKTRYTVIYHFQLQRSDAMMWMPVLSNPCLARYIDCRDVMVIPIRECDPCTADDKYQHGG